MGSLGVAVLASVVRPIPEQIASQPPPADTPTWFHHFLRQDQACAHDPREVSAVAVAVTVLFGFITSRRSAYERVMQTLAFLSEGPAAKARHRLGGFFYNPVIAHDERSDRIEDLFTVLWAARRIDAFRQSMWMAVGGPRKLLKESVQDWVEWWAEPDTEGKTRIDDVGHALGEVRWDATDTKSLYRLYARWCPKPEALRDPRAAAPVPQPELCNVPASSSTGD